MDTSRKISVTNSEEEKLLRILTKDPFLAPTRKGDPVGGQVEYSKKVSSENTQRAIDAENIQHLLPDVNMAKHLLVSTILSPKDLISVSLIYQLETDHLGEIGIELLRILEEHLDKVYKIKQKLPEMLRAILFEAGSYCVAVLPKSAIDDVITSKSSFGTESMGAFDPTLMAGRNLGWIGNPGKTINPPRSFSTESMNFARTGFNPNIGSGNLFLSITDNPDNLKMQELRAKQREDFTRKMYADYGKVSFESDGRLTIVKPDPTKDNLKKVDDSIFKTRFYNRNSVLEIKKSASDAVYDYEDTPMLTRYPAEAIIPIHVPSDPSNHIAYLVVIDTFGNPIRKTGTNDFMRQAMMSRNGASNGTSQMLERMRMSLMDSGNVGTDPNTMYAMYSEIIQNEIKERIRNGIGGDGHEVTVPDEVIRIMFSRSCSQMHTQLVYIPKMYMTYFALKYDDRGVGISLLESTKMLSALRSILLLGNMFASIKNSINYRKLGIQLSPKDPDPDDTVESAVNEFTRATQHNLPIMEPNAEVIVGYLQNAGTQVEVKGHPRYPETEITVDHIPGTNIQVDTDFATKVQEMHMHGLGVPPEAVNSAMDVNYAASILQSNLMFSKNAMTIQDEFTPQLTEHIRLYSFTDGALLSKLRQAVNKNRDKLRKLGILDSNSDEQVVTHFINNVLLTLPKPDLTQLETQLEAFKVYQDGLDALLPSYISADILSAGLGDQLQKLNITVDNYIAIIKAQYSREYLAQNNVMPQLFDLVGKTKEDKPGHSFAVAHASHVEGLLRTLTPLSEVLAKNSKALGALIDKSGLAGDGSDGGGGGYDNPGSTDETPPDGGNDDDAFGGDAGSDTGNPFGDDDADGGETPPPDAEAAPAETPPADDKKPEDDATFNPDEIAK